MSLLRQAIEAAYLAREKAIAVKTKVGVCIATYEGKLYLGANLENSIKKVYHAEEVAIITALMDGVRDKQFYFMIQIAFAEDRIYPCCLSCLAFLYEYTHPNFIIYTVHNREIVHTATLKKLVSGFEGADVYPDKRRKK